MAEVTSLEEELSEAIGLAEAAREASLELAAKEDANSA